MNKQSKSLVKTDIDYIDEVTMATGVNGSFCYNILNLSNIVEALVADGKYPIVRDITVHLRTIKELKTTTDFDGLCMYNILPIIVQTAGTFDFSSSQAYNNVNTLINQAIDDEFGFQKLREPLEAKITHIYNNSAQGYTHAIIECNMKIVIPQHIVALLRKEVSSEKLQDLYLGLVGKATGSFDIFVNGSWVINYTEGTKGITIR
jgi:hypothetical protein